MPDPSHPQARRFVGEKPARDRLQAAGTTRADDGSAIVMVLVMLVVVTTLTGAVMLVYLARHRLVVRDAQRLQAVYTAEAAVYAALARFETDPAWRATQESIAIAGFEDGAGGSTDRLPVVSVRALGGYLQVLATATEGHARATVRALVGQETFGPFEHAVVLGDTTTALTLTGRTQITGDLLTGPKGVRAAPLRRRPFTGAVNGEVERLDAAPLPALSSILFAETVERFEGYLDALPDSLALLPEVWEDTGEPGRAEGHLFAEEGLFADSLRILYVGDDGSVTVADSALLTRPVFLVGAGDLTLGDPTIQGGPTTAGGSTTAGSSFAGDSGAGLRLAAGSAVLAGGTLRVAGTFAADDCVLFADRVVVSGPAEFSGQVIARRGIEVDGGAYLRAPSVLYVAARDLIGPREDRIEVGRAVVEGTVVYPPHRAGSVARGEPARVVLGPESRIRGSVFNGRKTEAAGRVEGTLLTYQTYLYASPASYINWLSDPVLDREARPAPYLLPLLFPGRSRLAALRWAEAVANGASGVAEAPVVP